MSAPTPAPGDDRPRDGYYPDPSIPGYVRYWNGAAWVPGTSRPAPSDGEPLAPPPGARPAPAPAAPHGPAATEETGPHFFDEDPGPAAAPRGPGPADAQHGSRPEPASAWGADRSRQSGFGGDQDRRVSWGAPAGADPRVPRAAEPADGPARPTGRSARTDGTASIPPVEPDGSQPPASDGTVVFRRQTPGQGRPETAAPGTGRSDGTMTFGTAPARAEEPAAGQAGQAGPARPSGAQAAAQQALGLGPGAAPAARPPGPQRQAAPSLPQQAAAPAAPTAPSVPAQTGGAAGAAPGPAAGPGAGAAPVTSGSGGGQPSWAQQVHRLAGDGGEQPVTPWKPPVDDVFQAAARAQAAARPAGLGRRLAARVVDTAVLAAVTAVAAVPLGTKAVDHVNDKIDAAKLSGRTVTVWLLDGRTASCLGIVLAVLLAVGVVYEALPTARWGRTLGKKLCGIEVWDIEAHEPPSFGSALRRWLVYSVPGLLVVGIVGVVWCVFDKPWRQCWHDKAAHTFVAG
ncbi:RDD family protein [Streptomyces sp. NPDC008313]|uniref:RDD family protein n=1 Tax=Streptomyces sp. NPDC008313 TaxID=3364826 RepID=UPI0036E81273